MIFPMRKLLLGRYSAVIFLDEEDAYLLDGIYDELRRKDTARLILDIAGVTLPDDELYIELFEKEGRNILFVTAGDDVDGCLVYRFDNADNLMDAVNSVKARLQAPDNSELYEYRGALYLLLTPPYGIKPEQLREFGDGVARPRDFRAYLREYGRLLSSPAALSELATHF